MRRIMEDLDYRRFRDETSLRKVPVLGDPLALWFQHGLYAGGVCLKLRYGDHTDSINLRWAPH